MAAEDVPERQEIAGLQHQVEELQAREVEEDMSPESASVAGDELVSLLERLGELHRQGLLTAEEFDSAKTKLLGV